MMWDPVGNSILETLKEDADAEEECWGGWRREVAGKKNTYEIKNRELPHKQVLKKN